MPDMTQEQKDKYFYIAFKRVQDWLLERYYYRDIQEEFYTDCVDTMADMKWIIIPKEIDTRGRYIVQLGGILMKNPKTFRENYIDYDKVEEYLLDQI